MVYAAGSNADIIKGHTLWTSIWPLFVASILMTWALMAFGGTGAMGVGGLGAAILGAILSTIFARHPVYTVPAALRTAIVPLVLFELVVGYVFAYTPAIYELKKLGYPDEPARSMALRVWLIQSAIQTPVLALAWAIVIVRKANRLVTRVLAERTHIPAAGVEETLTTSGEGGH